MIVKVKCIIFEDSELAAIARYRSMYFQDFSQLTYCFKIIAIIKKNQQMKLNWKIKPINNYFKKLIIIFYIILC